MFELIDIGSFGFHFMHGLFLEENGVVDWKLSDTPKAIYSR